MKPGDWLTGIKYPLCDYAQILAVEESVSQIVYTIHCYRTSDNFETTAKIGFDKNKKQWFAAYGSIVGGKYWKPTDSKPRAVEPVKPGKLSINLFTDEEPDYE